MDFLEIEGITNTPPPFFDLPIGGQTYRYSNPIRSRNPSAVPPGGFTAAGRSFEEQSITGICKEQS
jgi:hypothetical protein